MSIAEDEALHFAATTSLLYSKHMDVALADAYKRGRLAPPTDTEIEAVAKKLLWRSCKKWGGIESDCVAKDEDDAWDYAGEICGYQEDYIARAKEVLEIARKAVTE